MRVILPLKDKAAKSKASSASESLSIPIRTASPSFSSSSANVVCSSTQLEVQSPVAAKDSKTGSKQSVAKREADSSSSFRGPSLSTSFSVVTSVNSTSIESKRKLASSSSGEHGNIDVKVGPVAKPSKIAKKAYNCSSPSFSTACGAKQSAVRNNCASSSSFPYSHVFCRSNGNNHRISHRSAFGLKSTKKTKPALARAATSTLSMVSNSDKMPLQKRRDSPTAALRERYEYNPVEIIPRNVAFLEDEAEMTVRRTEEGEVVAVDENEPSYLKEEPSYPTSSLSSRKTNNKAFREVLKSTQGLDLVEQEGDGNCLFRAVALQVYGDANMHGEIRRRCIDFMAKDEAHYSQFITEEPFHDYIERKRRDGVHGNHIEIQAISELYNRPVEVFVPDNGPKPINIFHGEYKTEDVPIRLSYHDGNHYNAVIDPLCPTAGLGLGLPGLQPGLADELQLKEACEESGRLAFVTNVEKAVEDSNNVEIERALRESEKSSLDQMYKQKALALSDLEATDFELEQAVLNSSLESYRNYELGRKQPWVSRGNVAGSSRNTTRSFEVASGTGRGHAADSTSHASGSQWTTAVASSSASSRAVAARTKENVSPVSPAAPVNGDEYPQTVQELVMNGFDLPKVLKAYELIGDNFDDLLSFLMSSTAGT